MPKDSRVGYLMKYTDDPAITNLGSLKEVDMEALNSLEPDVIFIGGRLSAEYDKLSEIAPVVLMTINQAAGYMNGFEANVAKVASIFGKETESENLISGFGARIAALKAAASGKTAIVGMVTSSSFNALPDGSRGSLIGHEAGFKNLTKPGGPTRERGGNPNAGQAANPHGDSASFELLVEKNPDYIFVLDRDAAIAAAGSKAAREVMENELVQKTDAYKNGRVVYLTPDVWYLAEGGITATDVMIRDL
jgi:iron complex transport system substrate-binding protein